MASLCFYRIKTLQGEMLAVADGSALYFLEFVDSSGLDKKLERLQKNVDLPLRNGQCAPIYSIEQELSLYFQGTLSNFQTPVRNFGTPFQLAVWKKLTAIPFGKTCSYSELAAELGKTSARRAVARANSANQLAIVVPCHRVINHNGGLGGYAGGVERKQWLLDHENRIAK